MLAAAWPWLFFLAIAYCVVQTVRDVRARRYGLAAFGALCVAILAFIPVEANKMKVDVVGP